MKNANLSFRLTVLTFLEFAAWGAYLTSIGRYLANIGLGSEIKWFFVVQGMVSLFAPALIGILADKVFPAQKVLSTCHLLAGIFMLSAGMYCARAGGEVHFTPLFTLYSLAQLVYMPTIGLSYSVSYHALEKEGMDVISTFPSIRVWGTVGFIASMLATNFIKIGGVAMQDSYTQLMSSGIISLIIFGYGLTLPPCPVNRNSSDSLADRLGFKAFTLFKESRFAVFFIFSMLLGASLNITNSYASVFLGSFASFPEYAGSFAVKNSNAFISISQISETLCILLIPFFLKRFGIKKVMLISMFAWVLRFALFGLGEPDMPGVLLLILSCIVYGIAFDFFNISGSMYINQNTDSGIRSSAQGLFMLMVNGIGASIGMLGAGAVVDAFDCFANQDAWNTVWLIFAGYALAVAFLFTILFKDNPQKTA